VGEFLMPSLGADMDAGTILEWRVQPGDAVHRGDIVAVVDTEKSDIEVEVFEDGVVDELLVEVGREVAVGTPLARISAAGEPALSAEGPAEAEPTATKPRAKPKPKQKAKAKPKAATAPKVTAGPRTDRVRSSPLARQRAAAQGIDLAAVTGTGPGGAVRADDVALAPARPAAAPAPPKPAEGSRPDRQAAMRRAIGELMARSKREIPHYYLATTIDLTAATAWLVDRNAGRPVTERLLPAALLLKATALAAREVPAMNGFWDDGFRPSAGVHLGVAVSLRGGGLIAPALHDADTLTLDELMAGLRDLVERARAGRLRSSEMSDPTLTVTNLGEQGAEEVFGVIYPPQVALVGFGKVTERPWASDGMVGARPTVRATLAADHRASEGHEGSRFLAILDRLLHAPEDL
jgi:pyruvate dehydrogenase E2 component (dihydrolipoamide acetyltransferase)